MGIQIASNTRALHGYGLSTDRSRGTRLDRQIKQHAKGEPITKEKFPHQIVDNLFSHNTAIGENGYNEEEMKMLKETRKIFGVPGLMVAATCVRVPVSRAHCESVNLEFDKPITPDEV